LKEFLLEEKLVMEKYEDFWGETLDVSDWKFKENSPDIIEMIGTTEPITVRTMMSRQELELTDSWQPLENLEEMQKTEGIEMFGTVNPSLLNLMLHSRKPPTDDVHFRKAIAYAFDYQTVVDDIFPQNTLVKGVVNEILPGYDPTLEPYRRNMEKAMEELQLSQYYDELDDIEIEIHWVAEVPAEERVALLFQSNMAELGINVKIVKEPWLSVVETMADQELSPNVVVVYNSVRFPEVGGDVMRYHSESAPTWEQNEWLLDETLDAMIEDALETVDETERFEKYSEIQQYLHDLSPTIYVCQTTTMRAMQDYLEYPPVEFGTETMENIYAAPTGWRQFYGLYTGINKQVD
jgi:peptide/nickel transport system substrate-binding protein